MINCPVCSTANHHLNITCSSCGGYVQGRVDNLDLFSTIWKLIERPGAAFLAIALARYKNYSTIVSAVSGIGLVFAFFWFVRAGDHTSSAFNLMLGGFISGPPVGVLLVAAMSLLAAAMLRLAGTRVKFRNVYAVLSYALVPVLLSVVFVLPLEIFTFGRYFFSLNPPPWLIKPVSYYLFLSLGAITAGWTLFLVVTGLRVLLDCRWIFSTGLASLMLLVFLMMAWGARYYLLAPAP